MEICIQGAKRIGCYQSNEEGAAEGVAPEPDGGEGLEIFIRAGNRSGVYATVAYMRRHTDARAMMRQGARGRRHAPTALLAGARGGRSRRSKCWSVRDDCASEVWMRPSAPLEKMLAGSNVYHPNAKSRFVFEKYTHGTSSISSKRCGRGCVFEVLLLARVCGCARYDGASFQCVERAFSVWIGDCSSPWKV